MELDFLTFQINLLLSLEPGAPLDESLRVVMAPTLAKLRHYCRARVAIHAFVNTDVYELHAMALGTDSPKTQAMSDEILRRHNLHREALTPRSQLPQYERLLLPKDRNLHGILSPLLDIRIESASTDLIWLFDELHRRLPGEFHDISITEGDDVLLVPLLGMLDGEPYQRLGCILLWAPSTTLADCMQQPRKQEGLVAFRKGIEKLVVRLFTNFYHMEPHTYLPSYYRAEQKPVALLCIEIREFDRIAEILRLRSDFNAEETVECLRKLVNLFSETAATVVERHRGRVDQIWGNGLLAVFGEHLDSPDPGPRIPCTRAVIAAAEFVEKFREVAASWQEQDFKIEQFRALNNEHITLDPGVAVDYGDVVFDYVGSATHRVYMAMGDHVNLTKQLARAAGIIHGESPDAYRLATTVAPILLSQSAYMGARHLLKDRHGVTAGSVHHERTMCLPGRSTSYVVYGLYPENVDYVPGGDTDDAHPLSVLRHLGIASSPSEMPLALTAVETALQLFRQQQHGKWAVDELRPVIGRLQKAVSPLRQYSEESPLALRTGLLFETLYRLEEEMQVIRVKGFEPARTLMLEALDLWRQVLRQAIRRIEGEARLAFSATEKVMGGAAITLDLEIHNHGPSAASNIRVQLTGEGLGDVKPVFSGSLAANTQRIFSFTIPSPAAQFTAEFVITYDDLWAQAHEKRYTASLCTLVQEWQRIRNPYMPGKPGPDVQDMERLFVGREDVVRFVKENLLEATTEQVVVLSGHRRTGKTWTLLHLQECLLPAYLPVYLDVQGLTGARGVPAVLQNIADQVLQTVATRGALDAAALAAFQVPTFEQYEQNAPYYFEHIFLHTVQTLLGERKLLWLVDEFQCLDDMVASGTLPATFMEFLRHLMQFGTKTAFIFAGTRELTESYWSVFSNIAVHHKIGVLHDAEASHLITNPVKRFGVEYERLTMDLVRRLAGNHPYFIQVLCDRIVSELNVRQQRLVNASIIEAATDDLVQHGASNLKFYWAEVMDEQERAVAGVMHELWRRGKSADVDAIWGEMSLMNARVTAYDVASALQRLTTKDLIEKDQLARDTYRFKIELVNRYIGAHVTYIETQERISKQW